MTARKWHKAYLILLWTFLLVPIGLQAFGWKLGRELQGHFNAASAPEWTWQQWVEGQFQSSTETWANHRSAVRPLLTRIGNQVKYILFGEFSTVGVVMGKEGYLFEQSHIDAYLGADDLGQDQVEHKTRLLRRIRKGLSESGTKLLVAIAPTKAAFMSEFLPASARSSSTPSANYQHYLRALEKDTIPVLDLSEFLRAIPNTSFPLFAKAGVHWTDYGAFLAADTLIQRIGQLTERELPKLKFEVQPSTDPGQGTDNDIGEAINLLWPLPTEQLGAPSLIKPSIRIRNKPNVLVIGDSFYWNLYRNNIPQTYFAPTSSFFYYFNEAWPTDSTKSFSEVDQLDLREQLESRDVVVLLISQANLQGCCFGFADISYRLFKPLPR